MMSNRKEGVAVRKPGRYTVRRALVALLMAACVALGAQTLAPLAAARRGDALTVTLKAAGFEPGEATREAGRLHLTVVNQSGRDSLSFRLVKVTGQEVYAGLPATAPSEWSRDFDLPAGRYVLTEAGCSDCRLLLNLL